MKKIKDNLTIFFQTSVWVWELYLKNYPKLTITLIITQTILSFSQIVNAYILGVVTDKAISIYTNGLLDVKILVPVVLIIIVFQLFFGWIDTIDNYANRLISSQDWWKLRMVLQQRLATLGIPNLENPEVANKTQRFNEEINNITGYLQNSLGLLVGLVAFVSSLIVLIVKIPLMVPMFLILLVLQTIVNQKYLKKLWLLSRDTTEDRRKAMMTSNQLIDSNDLKELIITGGYKYLEKKIEKFVGWYMQEVKKIRIGWVKAMFLNRIGDSLVFGFGLFLILQRLAQKLITVGQLTFEFRSLRIFADSFASIFRNYTNLKEMAVRINDSRELFFKYSPEEDGKVNLKSGDVPEINFSNVSFSYPDSPKEVFSNLNLIIKPGEKVAIIGENGAGKTTLVKLICRLYKVKNGEVKIQNKNIDRLQIDSWYKNLGVLFQDYNTYSHLNVLENVQIGDIYKNLDIDKVSKSLEKANAKQFVDEYPNKLEQILGEKFKTGIRPSTGQWQKIAIARFFYRDAPVLILDEPTASIDAVAEAQIFSNIYKFIKGKTVIIISHRFSTVRNADRIIVLDKGKIIEEGSHEELLKMNGKYAKAFNLQARGYA